MNNTRTNKLTKNNFLYYEKYQSINLLICNGVHKNSKLGKKLNEIQQYIVLSKMVVVVYTSREKLHMNI